jgi:MFS family permease
MTRAAAIRRTLGLAGRLALIGLAIGGSILGMASPTGPTGLLAFPNAVTGTILVIRRPRTSIGWILLGLGACYVLISVPDTTPAEQFVNGTVAPLAALFAIVHSGLGTTTVFLYAVLAMVFPSGRLPVGGWGRLGRAGLAAGVLVAASAYVMPELNVGYKTSISVANPVAVFPDLAIWRVLTPGSVVLPVMVLMIAGAVSLVVRVRRARGTEREQLRWFAASIAALMSAVVAGLVISSVVPDTANNGLAWIPAMVALPTVPIAIGIAVLRYRLYEIDRIISRSISYGVVTVTLVGVYAGLILLLQAPLSAVTGGDTIAVAASTLVAAGLFQPLRRRIQRSVDRRFNRARYDAERTAAAFATELRDEANPARAQSALLAAVTSAIGPQGAAVWIRGESR